MGKLDKIPAEKNPSILIDLATLEDIPAIQKLQEDNLIQSISADQIKSSGFLTLKNSDEELSEIINNHENNIFTVRDNDGLEGFLISATKEQAEKITYFNEFIEKLNSVNYKEKSLKKIDYCVLLQICIANKYKGKGVLGELYAFAKNKLGEKYDLGVGEIAFENEHSLKAHEKMGFEIIDKYIDANNRNWHIVAVDLKK